MLLCRIKNVLLIKKILKKFPLSGINSYIKMEKYKVTKKNALSVLFIESSLLYKNIYKYIYRWSKMLYKNDVKPV